MRRAALGLLFAVVATMLWACDGVTVQSSSPMATPAPAAALSTLQSLFTPTSATATPELVPIPTPTPSVTLEPWTPGPARSAPPLPTLRAGEELGFDDYFVVESNGLQGIVDQYGTQVLPVAFAQVKMVNYDNGGEYWSGQDAFPPRGRVLFFAIPPRYFGEKYDRKRLLGWLYNAQGERVNDQEYNEVCFIGEHVLRVWVDKGEQPGSGAISDEGEELLPLRYDSVEMIDDRIVASSNRDDVTDLYTAAGKKIRTMKGALPFSDRVSVGQGKYLKGLALDRPDGGLAFDHPPGEVEALIDRDLRVLLTGEDYSIDCLAPDRFTVRRGGKTGVVDSANRVIVPLCHGGVELMRNGSKSYFCANAPDGPGGCGLYDLNGKALYDSEQYQRLRLVEGRLIAYGERQSRVLSLDGRDLLGRDDVEDWLPAAQLYLCRDRDTQNVTLVREDGTELPLPRVPGIDVLAADRFLVWLHDDEVAVLDSAGNTVIPAVPQLGRGYDMDGMLFYRVGEGAQQRVWLVDCDGNRLWQQPVDSAQSLWGRGLFQVQVGPCHGLMDAYGRWIWSASDYVALDD